MSTQQKPGEPSSQPPNPYVAQGVNGQLTVTLDRIIISRKGISALFTQGLKGDKEVPLASITAIQMKLPGLTNGYIQFSILGGVENRGGIFDAVYDENTLMFNKKQQQIFQYAKELIEHYQQMAQQRLTSVAASTPISAADELAKWASLRDQGIISTDEFEAKKRQLLGL